MYATKGVSLLRRRRVSLWNAFSRPWEEGDRVSKGGGRCGQRERIETCICSSAVSWKEELREGGSGWWMRPDTVSCSYWEGYRVSRGQGLWNSGLSCNFCRAMCPGGNCFCWPEHWWEVRGPLFPSRTSQREFHPKASCPSSACLRNKMLVLKESNYLTKIGETQKYWLLWMILRVEVLQRGDSTPFLGKKI